MIKSKRFWILIFIIICIVSGVVFFSVDKTKEATNFDIKIHEHYYNKFAGRRLHENRSLLIDSYKCIGKVTYWNDGFKETQEFKINKKDIDKILNLVKKGKEVKEIKDETYYTIYEIELNSKITYIDSKLDEENIISNLFSKSLKDEE